MTKARVQRGLRDQKGATLIEILVSIIILMLGLLGLIGLMVQSQRAQLESYQRVQALLLVQDMVARITNNRTAADCYQLVGDLTAASAAPSASGCAVGSANQKSRATQDLVDWQNLLAGAAEVSGSSKVGAIADARGCITKDAATGIFQVSVAWQGIDTVGAPPAGITCGQGQYGNEIQRRAVSVTVLPPNAS
jgi:type IV pilus assembly protein PilV